MTQTPAAERLELARPFMVGEVHERLAHVPESFAPHTNTGETPYASRLELWEDGRLLGPRHAQHGAIVSEGGGLYSHWLHWVRFSSSDGSDPNANGRLYEVSIGAKTPKTLALGSCNLHQAMDAAAKASEVNLAWGRQAVVYTAREALQFLAFHKGQVRIAAELQPMALRDSPLCEDFFAVTADLDLALFEFNSDMEVVFEGVSLNRGQINDLVLNPLKAYGREAELVGITWYAHGLLRMVEDSRRSTSEQLLDLLPRAGVDFPLMGEIIRGARGERAEPKQLAESLRRLDQELSAERLCISTSPNIYTPDGRPINWAGGFNKTVEQVCREHGVPHWETAWLVKELGVPFSLTEDMQHYTDAFAGKLAERILQVAAPYGQASHETWVA